MAKPREHELLRKFKRVCKEINKGSDFSLMQIQEIEARHAGFDSFHHLRKSWSSDNRLTVYIEAQEIIEFTH